MINRRLSILLLLAICLNIAFASTVYFVSPIGSDKLHSGTSRLLPLRTINEAYSRAKHFDIIQLERGEYFGKENCIELKTKNITLVGPAILRCESFKVNGVNFEGINMTFSNLTISNAYNVSITNSSIVDDFSVIKVNSFNMSNVNFNQTTSFNIIAADFLCNNCSSFNNTGNMTLLRSAFECRNCSFPSTFITSRKPSSFILENSTFAGLNVSRINGVDEFRNNGTCNVNNTQITCQNGTATGINVFSSNCTFQNVTVQNCTNANYTTATGIVLMNSTCFFQNLIVNNTNGSSVYVGSNSTFIVINGTIANNGNSSSLGGGVFAATNATVLLENIRMVNNTSSFGGAIYASQGSTVIVTNSVLENNFALSNSCSNEKNDASTSAPSNGRRIKYQV